MLIKPHLLLLLVDGELHAHLGGYPVHDVRALATADDSSQREKMTES
ncbi:hypothetical protein ACFYXF_33355 [Streptomyces sp. NPDC002680]